MINSHWHHVHQKELETLWKGSESLKVHQKEKLDEVTRILESLQEQVSRTERNSKRLLQLLRGPDEGDQINPDIHLQPINDIATLEASLSTLHLSTTDLKKQQILLESLSFQNRSARRSAIPEAHRKTFRWAFHRKSDSSEMDLLKWLKHGDRIFWVSGKPGSGKSTFMKFIAECKETTEALNTWSYPKVTVVASHYFWCSGTKIQKSQQGLLQTLLFEIFRQCPRLIRVVCEDRWSLNEDIRRPWNVSELHEALQAISGNHSLGVKFCFFIDGLDEYEGDHLEFCSALKALSISAHIKLCLASRPWNAFQDAFGKSCPKLYIHDLTRGDIEAYTTDRLKSHPRWQELEEETSNPERLVREIVERSSGVFLWVFLVTKLLREGLTEYNSFWDLRKRLDSFPDDLEPFFKHILETVEPFHHNKMASTLSIAVARGEPMDVLIYHFHDMEYEDQNYVITMPFEEYSGRRAKTLGKNIGRQLNGRCRGLLDVDQHGVVNFLHRTVADFLNLGEMSSFLTMKAPPEFSANLSLLKAFSALLKSRGFPTLHSDIDDLRRDRKSKPHLRDVLEYAALAAEENDLCKASSFRILDDLDHCIMTIEEEMDTVSKFRDHVLQFKLLDYLRHKVPKQPSYLSYCKQPVLVHAAFPQYPLLTFITKVEEARKQQERDDQKFDIWPRKTIDLLGCLLDLGQNCNTLFRADQLGRSTTPWAYILGRMIGNYGGRRGPFMAECFISGLQGDLFTSFLSNGARPNARIHRVEPAVALGTVAWADFLFLSFDFPSVVSHELKYLTVLDDFMLGADFSEIGESLDDLYPGEWTFENSREFREGFTANFSPIYIAFYRWAHLS